MKRSLQWIVAACVGLLISAPAAFAQLTWTPPFMQSSAIVIQTLYICYNGVLIIETAPMTLLLLEPYVPVYPPFDPFLDLWGDIPGSTTLNNFFPGGVCYTMPYGQPLKVDGTLIQFGTTLIPSGFQPINF